METPSMRQSRQSVNFKKNFYENSLWELQKLVIGVDEVGRGCVAGPLVTAAAILPIGKAHRMLKDSKLMSPEERLEAYAWIQQNCLFQVGIIHNRLIDEINIYQATMLAMKKALVNLLAQCPETPGAILVDAVPLKLADTGIYGIPLYHFPKGERKSSSIAAASIVAKVTRDRLMEKYGFLFPGYELEQHKGYCTKSHQAAIKAQRDSIIHRKTFLGAFLDTSDDEASQQSCFE
jgi:ribonuclease HII